MVRKRRRRTFSYYPLQVLPVLLTAQRQHPVGKHPEDYTLLHVGTFNDETAELEMVESIESLGLALNYIKE